MRRLSGGACWTVLSLSCALVSGCGSSSAEVYVAGGAHAGGAHAGGAHAGAAAHGGSLASGGTAQGGSHDDGGMPGNEAGASAESGASGEAGAPNAPDGLGGAANVFIDQIVLTQGGGPPKCFPRPLSTGLPGSANDGIVSCFVAELLPGACDCSQTARAPLPAPYLVAIEKNLAQSGACGGTSGVDCDGLCGCEIVQAPGTASDQSSELYACQNDLTPNASVAGFCLIDQTRTDASGAPVPLGNPALVSQCPSSMKRLLRFVGAGEPGSSSISFIGCTQEPVAR